MEAKDIYLRDYLSSRIISQNKSVNGYGKIYYQVNEDLIDSCLSADFRNKNVLSVLSSGDHVLTSRFLDANNVDAFDINRLTLYYFYLRIWTIKYRRVLYPQILNGNTKWLASLLSQVVPSNEFEKKALFFFKEHLKNGTKLDNLFFDVDMQPQGRTIYTQPEELDDCLNPELSFYQLDLFKKIQLQDTYDIVLISNILEWARNDERKLRIAAENLSRLLSPNGTVICSRIINKSDDEFAKEKAIFCDLFHCESTEQSYIYIRK